jgi:hypothetical protein
MGLFGPSKWELALRHLSNEIGGTILEEPDLFGLIKKRKVLVYVNPWAITLEFGSSGFYGPGSGAPSIISYMSAPHVNEDGFWFKIRAGAFLSPLGKLFGRQGIEVGYSEFDRKFHIKANDKIKIKSLLGNAKIRQLIESLMTVQYSSSLEARKSWNKYRGLLRYTEADLITDTGLLTDVGHLKSILELLTETLNQMREIGSASPIPPSE